MRKYIVNLALKFQGTPYIWGGSNPSAGFDCSGFVIWVLQVFNVLPSGDWTADGLMKHFGPVAGTGEQVGDLAFYGKNKKASHVMVYVGNGNVVGASGGDSSTVNTVEAKKKNAMVKIKPFKYRNDFIGFRSIGDFE